MQSGEWRCNRCSQFYAQEAKEAKPRFSINSLESGQWIRHLPHKSILRGWFFGVSFGSSFFELPLALNGSLTDWFLKALSNLSTSNVV